MSPKSALALLSLISSVFFFSTSATASRGIISQDDLPFGTASNRSFFCEGNEFRVRVTETEKVELATGLTLIQKGIGKIATVESDKIVYQEKDGTLIYQGVTKNYQDGKFIGVKIEILEHPEQDGPYIGKHVARLTIHKDGTKLRTSVICREKIN